MLRRMRTHQGDVSEGSKTKVMAQRTILGRTVTFYENGLRVVDDKDLSPDDEFNSEVLRLAHASLLINDAVGDKSQCWVDARTDPVQVWLYDHPAPQFVRKAQLAIRRGQLDQDFVLNLPLRRTREYEDERNVRLFGR